MEAAGDSTSVSLYGISVASRDLCADRHRMDAEHDHHPAYRGILGNRDRADRRAGIFVLEARQPEDCRSGVTNEIQFRLGLWQRPFRNFRLAPCPGAVLFLFFLLAYC